MRHRWIKRMAAAGAVLTTAGVVAMATPSDAGPVVASATLVDINGNEVGRALFTSRGAVVEGRMTLTIDQGVTANAADFHGFHIHANNDDDNGDGSTDDGCITFDPAATPASSTWFTQVDGHWDVGGHAHGSHTGDLPSVLRKSDGKVDISFEVDKLIAGDLPGKALIVHFAADDFGKHPTVGTSATTGNAGFRYACGAIVATGRGW